MVACAAARTRKAAAFAPQVAVGVVWRCGCRGGCLALDSLGGRALPGFPLDCLHISRASGSVDDVTWSPDGTRIASASFDGRVQVWDAFTGAHVVRHEAQEHIPAVAWSPGGTRLASTGDDDSSTYVAIWEAATGNMISSYPHPAGQVAWSPDGRYLALVGDGNTGAWCLHCGRFA